MLGAGRDSVHVVSSRWLILLLAGCGRVAFEPLEIDAAFDPCAAERADLGAFGIPQRIAVTSTADVEDDPVLSPDGLEMYFASNRTGSVGGEDIYVARRSSPADPWTTIDLVPLLSSNANDNTPAMSSDGLEMWVVSARAGGPGNEDIWVSVRSSTTAPWPAPVLVNELSSTAQERGPAPYADDLRMVFHSTRPGGSGGTDFWESTRTSRGTAWTPPVLLSSVNTAGSELHPWLSPCGLRMFFQADRGGLGGMDFFVVERAAVTDAFGPERRLDDLSTLDYDQDIHVSRDLRHVVFSSDVSGDGELYEASR